MDNNVFRLLMISATVIIISFIVNYVRTKIYKPTYESNVQKPGKMEGCIVKVLLFLDVFFLFFACLGVFMKEFEMAMVFGGLAVFMGAMTFIIIRAHNTSYEENDTYFILTIRNQEYKVYYENIVDWKPSYNEIALLDKTRSDREYIKVNIKIFKPEILLRKIADMAFAGKFCVQGGHSQDPYRKVETVNYIANHGYTYLVEDYLQEIKSF